jgi:hypothetical protein
MSQPVYSKKLEADVESLALQDLYPGENVEFAPERTQGHELETAVWEQHQKIQQLSVLSTDIEAVNELAHEGAHLVGLSSEQQARLASGAVTFVNPFFQGENLSTERVYAQPVMLANHEHMYHEVYHYPPAGMAPGSFLNITAQHQGMDGAYQNIGAQISRRFSLAHPPVGGYELPLPGHSHPDSCIQFVMEDPSGKENIRESNMVSGEQGRRHSMGTPHLYCCPWTGCNKVFNRFYNLRSHYRIHSGEKPFTCNYCEAAFARNHDLKRHERIHLKTKPYACPTCSKAFSRNDAMNRHIRLNSCARTN